MPAKIWGIIGILLALWVAYDLYAGYTLLHRMVLREEEAALYWGTVGVWAALALWCLAGFFSRE